MGKKLWLTISEFSVKHGVNKNTVKSAILDGRILAKKKDNKGHWLLHINDALDDFYGNKRVNQHSETLREKIEKKYAQAGQSDNGDFTPAAFDANDLADQEFQGIEMSKTGFKTEYDTEYIPSEKISKARTEHFKAQKAQAEYLQTAGKLVEKSVVIKKLREKSHTVKNNLEKISDRISPLVAAETDEKECKRIIDEEIREVLLSLSGDKL